MENVQNILKMDLLLMSVVTNQARMFGGECQVSLSKILFSPSV